MDGVVVVQGLTKKVGQELILEMIRQSGIFRRADKDRVIEPMEYQNNNFLSPNVNNGGRSVFIALMTKDERKVWSF